MIKLFRNLRQNLLNEGKTTKYFKYAIGEIVLVMVGNLCPVRDILSVAGINTKSNSRAFRYEILYYVPNGTLKPTQ